MLCAHLVSAQLDAGTQWLHFTVLRAHGSVIHDQSLPSKITPDPVQTQ
jgi:hypothetical protein